MYEFVVCDDNITMCDDISQIVFTVSKTCNINSNVTVFYDYNDLFMNCISHNKENIIYILNIEARSESGITIAKMIREIDKKSIIIFITSHNELAYEIISDRLNTLTFVSKTGNYKKELRDAIKTAISFANPNSFIKFDDYKTTYSINVDSILYVTREGRKTVIVTNKKIYEVYLSLNKIGEMLPKTFIRSHRACIVNTSRIEVLKRNPKIIIFDNGMEIDLVGSKFKKDLEIICKK